MIPRIFALFAVLTLALCVNAKDDDNMKPRLVVMTDIGDCDVEPDDMESAVRLLAYADQFEIEAIMTTVGWNCDPYPESWAEYLDKVVDAYGKDVRNLMKRSGQNAFRTLAEENGKQPLGYWPSVEYVKGRVMPGSHRAGIGIIGKNNDTEGSEFLIKLADEDDDRPIWVAAWGSGNTLAQAIWKVKTTRTPEQLKAFVSKFRIYTITDQDMKWDMRENLAYSSHQWLRQDFKDDLKFIWDEGTWQKHCSLGLENLNKIHQYVQNHSVMGSVYPNPKYGVEGDTPSFLYVLPNGLSNPEDPAQAGWSGCHKFGISPDSLTYAWTSWEEPQRSITEGYKIRFYGDELNDFCARMQWAQEGQGNTNPTVFVNGKHSVLPREMNVKTGKTITLDASKTNDAEGNGLSFTWWVQEETSLGARPLNLGATSQSKIKFRIPDDAPSGTSYHVICEVHDNGPFNLVGYQRIILHVR